VSDPQVGPVFAFSTKHVTNAKFYAEIVGLPPGSESDSNASWLKAANSDVVFHSPEWFGVDDVRAAFERARTAKAVVGDFYGDYFFARDPDGRFIGIHVNEEHAHGHDHEH
jgi:hypothetical protein